MALFCLQIIKMANNVETDDLNAIDSNVLQEAGMEACVSNSSNESVKVCRIKPNEPKVGYNDFEACMHPMRTNDYDVKQQTGFNTMFRLLSFVMILCNGCLKEMQSRKTNLTWFEKWFLYFEWAYGHKNVKLTDMESEYKTSTGTIVCIHSSKGLVNC